MPDNPLSQELQIDDALHKQISTNFNYSHEADTDRTSQTALLNGLNLNPNEFVLLYDSTPYASKGHIALNLPCDANQPNNPLFQVLVGRAPDLAPRHWVIWNQYLVLLRCVYTMLSLGSEGLLQM